MTPSLDETLSRYLDGDLPPEEVEAVERRIAASPEVAAALEDLRALRAALAALPTELPPPPLRSLGGAPRSASLAGRVVPWVVAAAVLLAWVLQPAHPVDVVLAAGVSELSGEARIVAGDVVVDLHGRARITVEPPGGVLRPAEGKEEPMDVRMPLSALAGAAVTVAVLEGSALVSSEGEPPVTVEPGAAQRFGTPAPTPAGGTDEARAEVLRARMAALEAELAATRQELATSSFTRDVAQGQLELLQGTESRWPGNLEGSLTPERFESALREQIEQVPGVELHRVDCDEYPCLAALRLADDAALDAWDHPDASNPIREWFVEQLGDGHSMSVNRSNFRHDDYEARYIVLGGYDDEVSPGVGVRTKYRMDTLVQDLGAEVEADAEVDRDR